MDYYRPELPAIDKKEHHPLRVLLIVALCIILIALLASVISSRLPGRWSGPGRLVETHINAINRSDFRGAYTHLSLRYQNDVSFQEFHSGFGEFTHQIPFQSLKFNRVQTGSREASVDGILTGRDGAVVPVHYELIKEKGAWRIRSFQWTNPGELISL